MKDMYKVLGLSEDASDDAIKQAYRKLAKQLHPDATGGDKKKTERFKEIGAAYGVLGDVAKRAEYDRLRHAPFGHDGIPQGFDPDTFAQVFGGGKSGAPRGGNVRMHVGNDFDLGGLFGSMFGGVANPFGGATRGEGGGRARGYTRGQDLQSTLDLSFAEAALGTKKTLRTGADAPKQVTVPPGVETGATLRLSGQGAPAPSGGIAGDLHLQVRVADHPHLHRVGNEIELSLPLSIAEASLGTKIDVPTVDGPVRVTVPPGTSSGAKLRLRGKGIRLADGSRGDQICRIEVVVPRLAEGDAETRQLIEQLDAKTSVKPRSF